MKEFIQISQKLERTHNDVYFAFQYRDTVLGEEEISYMNAIGALLASVAEEQGKANALALANILGITEDEADIFVGTSMLSPEMLKEQAICIRHIESLIDDMLNQTVDPANMVLMIDNGNGTYSHRS